MKIAWLMSDPAFLGYSTSAGDEIWTRIVIAALQHAKHTVMWFTQSGGKYAPVGVELIDHIYPEKLPDVLVVTWRYFCGGVDSDIRSDYYNLMQNKTIEKALNLNVPVLLFNMYGNKLSLTERNKFAEAGIMIAEPSFFPLEHARMLMLPNLMARLRYDPIRRAPFMNDRDLVLIANDSGNKIGQMKKFLEPFAKQPMHIGKVHTFGNLSVPIDGVNSRPPLPHRLVIDTLAEASTTLHVIRASHENQGTIGIRWAEAASAATPSFVPSTFKVPTELEECLMLTRVKDGEDLIEKYQTLYYDKWLEATKAMEHFAHQVMRIQPWLDIVLELEGIGI